MRIGAIFLPGVITPAEVAYSALRAAFDDPGKIILRNLAVYDTDEPPTDYDLDAEIAAVLDTAKGAGLDRFHMVGYSRVNKRLAWRPSVATNSEVQIAQIKIK